MRITLVLTTLLILNFVSAYSQHFEGSAVFGLNATEIDGDEMAGLNKTGIFAGMEVKYPLKEKLHVSMHLLFNMKGSRKANSFSDTIAGLWFRLSANYIDVPFSLHYLFSERLHFHAGAGPSYLIYTKLEDEWGAEFPTDFLKKWDLSAHAGIEYRLLDNLDILGRYFYSALPINTGRPSNPSFSPNPIYVGMRNAGISAGFRYRFSE